MVGVDPLAGFKGKNRKHARANFFDWENGESCTRRKKNLTNRPQESRRRQPKQNEASKQERKTDTSPKTATFQQKRRQKKDNKVKDQQVDRKATANIFAAVVVDKENDDGVKSYCDVHKSSAIKSWTNRIFPLANIGTK